MVKFPFLTVILLPSCKAIMSQFELFMGDGWPQMMYETMFAAGDFAIENFFHSEKIPFYIYFMPIYFIFSHMMFNLVINQSQAKIR